VSEIHLGRLPEAEVALQQALEKVPMEPNALANLLVLTVLNGQDAQKYKMYVFSLPPAFYIDLPESTFCSSWFALRFFPEKGVS